MRAIDFNIGTHTYVRLELWALEASFASDLYRPHTPATERGDSKY